MEEKAVSGVPELLLIVSSADVPSCVTVVAEPPEPIGGRVLVVSVPGEVGDGDKVGDAGAGESDGDWDLDAGLDGNEVVKFSIRVALAPGPVRDVTVSDTLETVLEAPPRHLLDGPASTMNESLGSDSEETESDTFACS